jgi:hypothetical protein
MTEYCWSFPHMLCHSPEHFVPMRGVLPTRTLFPCEGCFPRELCSHASGALPRRRESSLPFVPQRTNWRYTNMVEGRSVCCPDLGRNDDAGSSGRRHHRFGL